MTLQAIAVMLGGLAVVLALISLTFAFKASRSIRRARQIQLELEAAIVESKRAIAVPGEGQSHGD